MSFRRERLADEIRDIIASLFLGGRLSDPSLSAVTISAVNVTGDLQIANVYYRVYAGANADKAQQGLLRVTGLLRREIARTLRMRRVPELRFMYDVSIERAARVEELLQSIATMQ